jgi:hypothetical protein
VVAVSVRGERWNMLSIVKITSSLGRNVMSRIGGRRTSVFTGSAHLDQVRVSSRSEKNDHHFQCSTAHRTVQGPIQGSALPGVWLNPKHVVTKYSARAQGPG